MTGRWHVGCNRGRAWKNIPHQFQICRRTPSIPRCTCGLRLPAGDSRSRGPQNRRRAYSRFRWPPEL